MKLKIPFLPLVIAAACALGVWYVLSILNENRELEKVIARLTATSRAAEVLVTGVRNDPASGKALTTIKFLEYDTEQKPLAPRYFTFSGNIIQFQSMVIRFDDFYVKKGDPLKGKSAYVFLKAFVLDGGNSQVFEINKAGELPSGYEVRGVSVPFQQRLWKKFWAYALDAREAQRMGIKNAQIEAPGSKFLPGIVYTIRIEHGGGMRIDTRPLPEVVRGETLNF